MPARVDLLPTPSALRSGNWCRVVDVRAPLSRPSQCWHCPVIKQNRVKEIGMLAVWRDRQFFVGLDVGAIELARTLCDQNCHPRRACRRFRSRAAVTRPRYRTTNAPTCAALPAWILPMMAAPGVHRAYSAPIRFNPIRPSVAGDLLPWNSSFAGMFERYLLG